MAKQTAESIIERIRKVAGDTEEVIEISTDIRDSMAGNDGDWEKKYKELDQSWRKRYMDAFSGKREQQEEVTEEEETEEKKKLKYEDLFKKGE